jgi:hypothetical protein
MFQALFLAHHLLGLLRIRPEIGVNSLLLDFSQLLTQLACVKGTPGGRELCPSRLRILARILQTFVIFLSVGRHISM